MGTVPPVYTTKTEPLHAARFQLYHDEIVRISGRFRIRPLPCKRGLGEGFLKHFYYWSLFSHAVTYSLYYKFILCKLWKPQEDPTKTSLPG